MGNPVLLSKRIFQTAFTKTYLESRFDASRDSISEETKPTDRKNSFRLGKDSYKIFFLYALDALRPPEHENVGVKSRNFRNLKFGVRLFIAIKEFSYIGIHQGLFLGGFYQGRYVVDGLRVFGISGART